MTLLLTDPHPYQLGKRDGRWQAHGCLHCAERPGADIHDPRKWDTPEIQTPRLGRGFRVVGYVVRFRCWICSLPGGGHGGPVYWLQRWHFRRLIKETGL